MEYDVRSGNYTFKHIADTEPQTNQERFREHYHTTYELLYFLQGDADFSIQYTVYKLKPHCLLVIKPGEMHNVMIKSTARYERIVLRFGIESISPLLRQRLDALDKVYAIKGTHLSEELFRMDRLYQEISEDMRLTAFLGALDIILSYLCNGSNKSILADFVNEEIAPIVAYIDQHIAEIQTLDDICLALHMSQSTIKRTFFDHYQTPVMTYVRTQKCMMAHAMLSRGVSATEACTQCGFQYYSTFYRAYKQIFKHPPSNAMEFIE